jgi:cytoskeleton-associated protein 5
LCIGPTAHNVAFSKVKKPTAPPTAAISRPAAVATTGKPSSKGLAASPNEPVRYKYSQEDAEAKAADFVPKEIQTGLADAQWKERLASAEQMVTWLEDGAAETGDSEILFRFMAKTPGWNEKNFQVGSTNGGVAMLSH